MAETCKNALFILALVTCFQILLTEGRPIKSANKQELGSSGKESMEDVTKQGSLTAKSQKVSLTSPPVTHNPSGHHSKAGRKEMTHPTVAGFNNSAAVDKDAFRPTTPGVSPGVGHPHTIGTKRFPTYRTGSQPWDWS
ncbi:PRECURSOR OF CEP1-RELATED [Salix viminalis]|uniref:PRECURSOR OF CEP1-RELATED n=1 Tax=Salix viminalis TaxID=40686 RepID=A0A9Q0UV88_SALVM|nr:PRECURSOR OF CEP1-RELATED [Salix viminalis]